MPSYVTPGLYIENVDTARTDIDPSRVDIPAFIGMASQGPVNQPTQINSQAQFQAIFGGFVPYSYLAYVVKAFFENGGTRCYVVRVAAQTATCATVDLNDKNAQKTLTVTASGPGTWGNGLTLLLTRSSNFSTRTVPSTLNDHSYVFVDSIVGFSPGTLVSVFQAPATQSVYRIVRAAFAQQKMLLLDAPLDKMPVPNTSPERNYDFNNAQNPISLETIEFSLTVYLAGTIREIFSSLSLVDTVQDEHNNTVENPHYIARAISAQTSQLIRVQDQHAKSDLPDRLPLPTQIALTGGTDDLAHTYITDFIGDPTEEKKRGLRTLEDVREVATIAMTDLTTPAITVVQKPSSPPPIQCVPNIQTLPIGQPAKAIKPDPFAGFALEEVFQAQQAMIEYCEQQQRCIALLDPPLGPRGNILNITEIQDWRRRFDSKYAALYYPQLLVYDPLKLGGNVVRSIPPCGHVAGMFARVDAESGPHRAPANEALNWVQAVNVDISAAVQGILNPQGINCIRTFAGRGVRIYGARTLSSDPSWLYVNVRRLFLMIERSLDASTQWAAFEPNNFILRQTLVLTISTFLETLWLQGMLAGAKPAEAFFVKCDDKNNPPALADSGQLLVEVGIAPSIPAEFVVLRIGLTQNELEVLE